jgi:transcriptional regulator with XRE-family HTH domain
MSNKALPASAAAEIERLEVVRLGAMLRERRGSLSLRQAAADANVSFSTFSRVESGSQPDLTSFMLLCAWLGVPPSDFFAPIAPREKSGVDAAISHLSSDPRLGPDAAGKIADVLRTMYDALAQNIAGPPVVACHLRAASVLRPGVPERLNKMLSIMNSELERLVDAGRI